MKNIKPFSDIFEEDQKAKLAQNMADDENAEKMEEELKEAFMRYLLNAANIKPENVISVDAYNKYCIITTKNDDPVRIDFIKKYVA